MSNAINILTEIDKRIADWKTEKAAEPKYLLLTIEQRQAIKQSLGLPEWGSFDLGYYHGIPVIKYEEALICH